MPKLFMMLLLFAGLVKADLIELKKDNFVSLREPISQDSSSRLLSKLNSIESKHEILYVYINSPGGSVTAGLEIINYIKSLQQRGKEVKCIAHNAMSMAFLIFQFCSQRLILHSSTLMQHQMSLEAAGKLYDMNSRMGYLNTLETSLNQQQATRLDMKIEDFTKIIQNDWWLYAEDIIKHKAADKIVSLFCSFDNYDETVVSRTLFGDVSVKYSACPLINYPLQITFPSLNFGEEKKKEFMNMNMYNLDMYKL